MTLTMLLEFVEEEHKTQFRNFYYDHEKKLYAVAFSILKNQHKAEDAVSESFLKIIKHFEKIISLPCTKMEAYIVTIVKNVSIDMLRERERYADEETALSHLIDDSDGPEEKSAYCRLVELIRAMPERYRTPLELVLVLEWTPKEAARFLKCNENTLNSRLRRGREMLKEKLREEGYHD